MKLEHLVVENYRGASTRLELEFDAATPLVVIFGENGTGKTTIADALDAVGNCSKGSIGDKSSTNPKDHLPTIGKKSKDVGIALKAGGKTWSTSFSGSKIITTPDSPLKIRVLRRSHLQRLIDAPPSERYETLRHFINVDGVERSEAALRDAVNSVKSDYENAVRQLSEATAQLENVWEGEGKPDGNARAWAVAVAAQDTQTLDQQAQELRNLQQAITAAEGALAGFQDALVLEQQCDSEVKAVEAALAQLPGVDARQALSLAEILRKVEQHLKTGTHRDECPICQQGISVVKLKADIETRLDQLKTYDAIRDRRERATRQAQVARDSVGPKRADLLKSARLLLGQAKTSKNAAISGVFVTSDYPELDKVQGGDETLATSEAGKLIALLAPVKQSLQQEETATTKRSGQISSVRELSRQVENGITDSKRKEQQSKALQAAYDVARLARIEFTQSILDDVANECNRLYACIHPGEPIALSKLELDQGRRASLNQVASFAGRNDVPPQAYFSESHLDTLAFCFWLAIAKRESPNGDAILVLDDVFTSVDAQHINRIAQLITDESKHFAHVIVTTHQRLWRDIYRYHRAAGKTAQMIDLQRWTLSKGISSYKTQLAVDELIASLVAAPFDRQVTASKAGVLLESILDHLSLQYRCRVARSHNGAYTLGELLDGTESLFKKLELHKPELDASGVTLTPPNYVTSTVTDLLKDIRAMAFLRNQVGAHFNVDGLGISDADVEAFADAAARFAQALSCPTCGQIPGKKATNHYQCSCTVPNEVRMLPLQM